MTEIQEEKYIDYLPKIEALLMCASEPVTLSKLSEILGISEEEVLSCLTALQKKYDDSSYGFLIQEISGGFLFGAKKEYGDIIEKLVKPRLTTLTQASLETLSIIAYRQPVTRGEIEQIRGVNSDSSISKLIERNLIYESGRKDTLGKPALFSTTNDFLKYFGLTSLSQLPALINEEDFEFFEDK